jgi:serine/tyrosine/threonine adenylyltransferase
MVLTPHYANLPEKFFEKLDSVEFSQYSVLYWNEALAKELGLRDRSFYSSVQLAQAYAGHQFGHFVPQLGDGRARLVGEIKDSQGQLFEVHLKGSGPTKFSRRGDGLATLDAVLRELLVSEGMHALGIPTTRTLAVLGTGEKVYRENEHPGAIQVRIGRSHVRVGTFEYFAARGDTEAIKILADEMIHRLYPQLQTQTNSYLALFEFVIEKQIQLVARWLQVGFIHGVMNTDNTLISGETIDYGPCAFMEAYDPLKVFSSIDHRGRYAYARQPQIIKWNLAMLGHCLLPLFAENREASTQMLETSLSKLEESFHKVWLGGMLRKLGIFDIKPGDEVLLQEFLVILHQQKIDFTLGFRNLSAEVHSASKEMQEWLAKWTERVTSPQKTLAQVQKDLQSINPIIIPRNHLVERAIQAAVKENDFSVTEKLLQELATPFFNQNNDSDFQKPATADEEVRATFCGT